ncbi:hypothetical protein ACF1BE_31115 [Streptomyces sp. NPDC014991]|uniref:hypothetical protein n=1 Tax=Streptomyces sp. NPDC014991 TaxID=3364935 RepID=UPI0036F60AA3
MASRVEKYLARLDRISGRKEPRFFPVESTKQGLRGVTEIVYDSLPDGRAPECSQNIWFDHVMPWFETVGRESNKFVLLG